MRTVSGGLVAFVVLLAGCAHEGRPFTNSSADFNRGRLHHLQLECDSSTMHEALVELLRGNGALLLEQKTVPGGSLVLRFRSAQEHPLKVSTDRNPLAAKPPPPPEDPELVAKSKGGSEYYFEISTSGTKLDLKAIGLPIARGLVACPSLLATRAYSFCTPDAAPGSAGFAEVAEAKYSVRLDGAPEADIISRVIGELDAPKWRMACAGVVAPTTGTFAPPPLTTPEPKPVR